MSNACRIINYLQPQGEFLTFFSELNSDLKVGDKVFIIGGNYENITLTEKGHVNYNPFDEFATGYTVLAVDNTENSNAITLNIQYRLAKYNLSGINTSIFNPLPVYKTEEELLLEPNQLREAYISKSYFKSGEFNGGVFSDGIIGEYNIKGETSNKTYERQKFVDLLEEKNKVNLDYDYSTLTSPAESNKLKFNNNFTSDIPASFKNGIFLGGEYQWGEWNSKFDANKEGKKQTLNDLNQPFNSLDESKFNIQKFTNNNSGYGYAMLVSGNIGKIYENKHSVEFVNEGTSSYMIFKDYIPYPLWKSTQSNFIFNFQIRVKSEKNNKIFDIKSIDIDNKKIIFEDIQKITIFGDTSKKYYEIEQLIFNEITYSVLELYVKHNDSETGIKNTIDKATILHPDIFGGVINNSYMQGGDVWGGEFRKGRYASKYSQLNWWDGIFNGKKEESFLENVRWENGTIIDGNWKGDITIPIKNYSINTTNNTTDTNLFYIDIPDTFKHLFKIGEYVFISYIKKSVGSRYFQNFTDQPTEYPLNFREFELTNILVTEDLSNLLQVRLELKGAVDFFKEDVSLQYAKVSQSYFNKGLWNDGIWESGLRKVVNKEVLDVVYTSSTSGINKEFTLKLNSVEKLYLGERVEVSNIELVRQIEIGIIDGTDNLPNFNFDDRGTNGTKTLTYIEPLNQTLTILEIDNINNEILVKFTQFEKIELDEELTIKDNFKLIDIRKKLNYNQKSELTEAIWVNGQFNSGAWNGGIFRNGDFKSKLYFDLNNTEIQSVFQSGYWKDGNFTNSTFLSGVWENGNLNSGVVSNLFNNSDTNSSTKYDNGDTVFIDGTINNVEWRRGLMLKSKFNNGKIINGSIENITFNAGQYTNGLGIYKNTITSNRSGRQTDDKKFTDLSAPSMIYVDGDGWVQLDQPSYFQKDYNVIFKDLDRFPNPLNGQMFDILNRDKFSTKVKIDYSTSGGNPLYLKEEFKLLNPILAVDNMNDFAQINDDIYWIADSGNNRILTLNIATKKVDVLGKIYLQDDIWNLTGVKFITTATKYSDNDNLEFVYIVDSDKNKNIDIIKRISLDENNNAETIIDYTTPLLNGENIIDIKAVIEGTAKETILALTSQNRILYTSSKTNELKTFNFSTFLTNGVSITPLRKINSNSIDLLILNNNTISHLVLDYNTSTDVYTVRIQSPINITGLGDIENTISTFSARYNGNIIEIFIVTSDAEKNGEVYKFSYNEYFNGDANEKILLNDNEIEYPIFKCKLSQRFEKLNSILLHKNNPLILSTSELFKKNTGFGNVLTQVKLFDITTTESLVGYNYWAYDDVTNRLIFVDETNPNQYDNSIDIDMLIDTSTRYEILKMTHGESKSIIYSIQKDQNNIYSVRKTERGKNDNENSLIFTIDNCSVIYDIVYIDKLFVLLQDINNSKRILELNQTGAQNNAFNGNEITLLSNLTTFNKMNFDLLKNGSSYTGIITASTNTYSNVIESRINNNSYSYYNVYTEIPYIINDVLIKFEESVNNVIPELNSYSAFFITSNGIVKTISDKLLTNKFRWSNFGDNIFYDVNGAKEVYLDVNDNIIVSFGSEFSLINTKYLIEDNTLESFNIVGTDNVLGLSNSRLLLESSTSSNILEANISSFSFNIGRFDQNSTSGSLINIDFLLRNPKSLVKSKTNRIFFIDGNVIRYYDYGTISNNYNIVPNITGIISDLSYLGNGINDLVYYVINNTDIYYFNASTPASPSTFVLSYLNGIKKLSVAIIGGNTVYAIIDNNNDVRYYNGSWTLVSNDSFDDVVLTNDGTQELMYLIKNNIVYYIEYNAGAFNGSNIIDIPSNTEISIITESDNNNSLLYYDLTTHNVYEVTIDTNSRNENFVKLKDFSLQPYTNTNNVFLYNEPILNPKGVIKQIYTNKSIKSSTQINNHSSLSLTATFMKIVSVNANICYVLFNDNGENKLFQYNFIENKVTSIINPTPLYRNTNTIPNNISQYKLIPSDISHYDDGRLIILFQYYNNTTPENYYDAFLLENNATFSKTDIEWLYGKDSNNHVLPINNLGITQPLSSVSYPTGLSPEGNLQVLFKSDISPKIYSDKTNGVKYVTLYFGNTNNGAFLKLTNDYTVTPLVANSYNDLILKITLPTFNKNAETVTSVVLTPDPHTNTNSLVASTTGTTSITIGTDTITLLNNEIWAIFTNNSEFVNIGTFNYEIRISTTILSSRITGVVHNNGISDFRVYQSSGDNIVIKDVNSFDTISTLGNTIELTNVSTGVWELNKYNLNHVISTTPLLATFVSPVPPTPIQSIDLIKTESNINDISLLLDSLNKLDNDYLFDEITKGYKVTEDNKNSSQTLSPYLTSRILYDTILNEGVLFNNLGTPKTAHFVASRWNNNLFLGTWDEPTYFNNNILEKYSVFANGIFEGDFYDGFFLGGTFRNNSKYQSNLLQGHFISDNKNIDIQSGNVESKYRYDISKMYWKNNKLNFTLEGLYLDGDDYKNYPISLIGKGSWVTIPNLFNKLEFVIDEIWNSKIKVDGKNEITLVIKNPKFLDTNFNDLIPSFLQEREIFIQSFEYVEELFGSYKTINVFKKDDTIYVTLNSDFNKFNSQGKYLPVVKPKIIFNKFVKILSSNSYMKDGKAYSEMSIDLSTPLNDESDIYNFIEKIYLKSSIEIIKSGEYKGYIQIPNYSQLFNTSLTKTDKNFNAMFNSSIENLFISDIVSTGINDNSKIQINISNDETVIAHDIMVENSHIETPTLRNDVYVENSIFLSGKLYSNIRTSAWLSVDDKGFSHGNSQIGDENNLFTFDGNNTQIKNIYFEGNEYLWIELENIMLDIDKYRYITLRGFSGDKSQIIGATRSKVFRIEEIKDNLIKIENPFLYYNNYIIGDSSNFNMDKLELATQTMLLKETYGDNIKCSVSDAIQLKNNTFSEGISNTEVDNGWYYKTTDTIGKNYETSANGVDGLKATFVSTTNSTEPYKITYQKYDVKAFVNYTFDLNYSGLNTLTLNESNIKFEIFIDGVSYLNNTINTTNTFTGTFNFAYYGFEDKLIEIGVKISGNNTSSNNCYGVIDSLIITNKPSNEEKTFNYGWASPSTFNGGDFYGDFNSIWNAGNFRMGNFNGQWFGSEENRAWNGNVWLETITLTNSYLITITLSPTTKLVDDNLESLGGASVEIGDLIYLNFNSAFRNGEIIESFGGYYGVVEASTSGELLFKFESNDNIESNKYAVNITRYRKDFYNNNYLINDFNFNTKINDDATSYDFMNWNLELDTLNGTNSVLLFNSKNHINTIDYINIANNDGDKGQGFSIDFIFNYEASSTIQPLLAFQDTTTSLNGIKIYIKNNQLYLKFLNNDNIEVEYVITHSSLNINTWYHIIITFGTINIKTQLSVLENSLTYNSETPFIITNDLKLLKYDICFIGKMLNLESDKSISSYIYSGKMDEIRIWNLDLNLLTNFNDLLFDNYKLNKFINKYISQISAHWNSDNVTTLDSGKYSPEEESYFVLKGNNTIVLQDDISNSDFSFRSNNLFLELDFFPEQYNTSSGEYKLLTIQETRELPNNTSTQYYLELVLKEINKTQFYFIVREKVTRSDDINSIDNLLKYPFIPNQVDYSKDIRLDNIENYKHFYKWYNLILTDNELYINGVKIGEYNLANRNVFKYTTNTKIVLGEYQFAKILGDNIEKTNGLLGFISNINLWENKKYKDEYAVYRILSAENIDLYNDTSNITTSNNLLKSGNAEQLVIPYFNTDGSNPWETYIYTSENGYTSPINSNIVNINTDYLTTALPQNTWLSGTDFKIIITDNTVIDTNITTIVNENYLLTQDSVPVNSVIEISNMGNFKFFNKKISDNNGVAKLNVTNNGYLFFENLILDNLNYPITSYTDNENSNGFKQVNTTDAIMLHTILDIRSGNNGFVKYADREDEFVIEFYGKSTNFTKQYVNPYGDKYFYNQTNNDLFSFYAIRFDKKNSTILVYVRRLDKSSDQKVLALRRSDGDLSYINDTSGLVNYYKQPNTKDFVIGFQSDDTNVVSSPNTEYITFIPRFNVIDETKDFVDYLATKDYDYLNKNFGLKIFKQFKGTLLNQYDLINDTNVNSSINKKYITVFPTYKTVSNNDYSNNIYDVNEQFTLNSSSFTYNLSKDENINLVSRYSFFYNGNFNAPIWHNGVFVDGLISVPDFIWKYGIKHNGRLQGGELLKNYAHWLGGYHLGVNDNSFMRNLVWTRGIFDGGTWEKGHWLSLDLENSYKDNNMNPNNNWSVWRSGEWYSRVNEEVIFTTENLYKDANNGTFGGVVTNWNLEKINTNTSITTYNTYARIATSSPTTGFGFKGKSKILVKRNTEYTVSSIVKLNNTQIFGVNVNAVGEKPILNILNIGYKRTASTNYYDIKENNNNSYSLIAETDISATIKHTFNTGDNDYIYVEVKSYSEASVSNYEYFVYNIEMIGENIEKETFNPYDIKNHDSVWHGGIWESDVKETGELDEFETPIYYPYTWQSNDTKLFKVKNNQILTLPTVNSIWLGGLWLRGEFKGGIFANGYWHSVDCKPSTNNYVYEDLIGHEYNSTSSVFYNGKMINSIWYGGTVSNSDNDKLNVIFGDLVNLNSNIINKNDFTWNKNNDFKFKKSDFSKAYSNDILGRETFTGYHYDPINDGSEKRLIDIEKTRVRRQVNSDGIMSVYWKRGSFDNGILQFSHWDSLDLNNERQTLITETETKNNSIFKKGLIHSSLWKNGLFIANSSRDRYPLLESDEPVSLFYYSRWEKGYWKSKGLKNSNLNNDSYYSSLDTTDNIEITNALFSRSLWDAGVFEGGTMDLSIWRSGVSENNIELEYKNTTVDLIKGTESELINNFAFLISDKAGTNSDFVFSTSSLAKGLDFIINDSTFIDSLKDSKYRWVGSVDNLSSIFVNGHMRGTIWHGGVWQRGMFSHKNLDNVDFFNRDIIANNLEPYQLGVWNRGLWLSGYFSFYDDKIIDKRGIDILNSSDYLYNNANNSEAGRRSIFMSIDAENVVDNNNFIGINSVAFNNLINDIQFKVNDKNNYASFFMRRLLKERTDVGLNIYPNKKPYFSVMNGSVLNGVLYNNMSFSSNSGDEDRYILSLFSSVSDTYHKTSYNNTLTVSKNNIEDANAFIYDISYSKSLIERFTIPYSSLSPVTWSTEWEFINEGNSNYKQIFLTNYNNGFASLTTPFPHIWRHNYDEKTSFGTLFGDGTIVNGTNGLREMFIDNTQTTTVQISLAQGNGMRWIADESAGEPKYLGDEIELNYEIISFFSNTIAPNNGFEDYGTNGFETNI